MSENKRLLLPVLNSDSFQNTDTFLPVAIGHDRDGRCFIADIESFPHLLIAGAAGTGKSMLIHAIANSLICRSSPYTARLIVIDGKDGIELSRYNGISHLLIPVINEPVKAIKALNWAVTEISDRYRKFSAGGIRDIHTYRKMKAKPLPPIVIIIDEISPVFAFNPREVQEILDIIALKGRAAGVHLIASTASTSIIRDRFKAVFPSQISFSLPAPKESRSVIGVPGAESLRHRGEMLLNLINTPGTIRLEGFYISDEETDIHLKDKTTLVKK